MHHFATTGLANRCRAAEAIRPVEKYAQQILALSCERADLAPDEIVFAERKREFLKPQRA
jgi:hypothetical protein